jgi:hypothetical protein
MKLVAALVDRIIEMVLVEVNADPSEQRVASAVARARLRDAGETQRPDNQGPRPVRVGLPGGDWCR